MREGLEETLTIKKFNLPDALTKTLSSTNAIENINGGIRHVCNRVRRWKGGTMILRWVGAALVEHSRGFRRLRGHAGMRQLVDDDAQGTGLECLWETELDAEVVTPHDWSGVAKRGFDSARRFGAPLP